MSLQRQLSIWFAALVGLIVVLWVLSGIMLPFIAGLVLAYFLHPAADVLERLGVGRAVAAALILVGCVIGFAALIFLLLPILAEQISGFASRLPAYFKALADMFNEAAPDWMKEILTDAGLNASGSASQVAAKAASWILSLLGSIWSRGLALFNFISLIIITPIVIFYLLNDWDRMVAKVDGWLPRPHLDTLRGLAREMDAAMAGFIRGQGIVCLVLGLFYAIALIAAGLDFGLLIGLAAGLLSFIPFVGSIIGGALSIGVALVQFWPDWVSVVLIAAIFALGQFIEGNFLSPKLVGGRIGLHPVWLMFALFAFGYMFGFAGLLLAVPMAAAAGVLCRFALAQYLASELYAGSSDQDQR